MGVEGKGEEDGYLRDQDGQVEGGMEGESHERDILIDEANMGLERNLVPGKLPGTHKDHPS